MEEVLDTYEEPYNSKYPVLCMDEQPIQFHRETRKPIPATRKHARRVDYEYERCGTGSVFIFTEPLSGWREVRVRDQRTKVDWAIEMERILTTRYRSASKVIVVCDNLNTQLIMVRSKIDGDRFQVKTIGMAFVAGSMLVARMINLFSRAINSLKI